MNVSEKRGAYWLGDRLVKPVAGRSWNMTDPPSINKSADPLQSVGIRQRFPVAAEFVRNSTPRTVGTPARSAAKRPVPIPPEGNTRTQDVSMAEDWDFYLGTVEDHPASIFVDLGQAESAPEQDRPHLLRVSLKLQSPRDDGLSEDEETETLYAIEDELFAGIGHGMRARYVGRMTTQGNRDHFYYGRSAQGFSDAVARAFVGFPQYKYRYADMPDPEWDVYFGLLHPSALDMQTIQSRRVVDGLVSSGDDLSQPRDVDHWLHFPSEHSRDQFIAQVENEGFRVEKFADETPHAEFCFGLKLIRNERVSLDLIGPLAVDLFIRAETCGGEYGGWGCSVVSSGE